MSGPLCIGLSYLFDSVDPGDHLEAATYCARCPVADWCAGEAARGEAWGTWAGVLYGKRSTGEPRLPRASARRIAEEDALYDDEAARTAHSTFEAARAGGTTSGLTAWTRTGERVYQRRMKRAWCAKREVA